jgi:uncharacterized coiled-coil DUF342 family protein
MEVQSTIPRDSNRPAWLSITPQPDAENQAQLSLTTLRESKRAASPSNTPQHDAEKRVRLSPIAGDEMQKLRQDISQTAVDLRARRQEVYTTSALLNNKLKRLANFEKLKELRHRLEWMESSHVFSGQEHEQLLQQQVETKERLMQTEADIQSTESHLKTVGERLRWLKEARSEDSKRARGLEETVKRCEKSLKEYESESERLKQEVGELQLSLGCKDE